MTSYVIQDQNAQLNYSFNLSEFYTFINIFSWFPTQQAQECVGKLLQKSWSAGASTGHFAIFQTLSCSIYLDAVSTPDTRLGINQIYFILHSAVLHQYYHSFSCCNRNFSAHLVARFIVQSHLVATCACSELCALHIITPCPRSCLSQTCAWSTIAQALTFLLIDADDTLLWPLLFIL